MSIGLSLVDIGTADGSRKKDGWTILTKKAFLKTCDRIWREAGLPAIPYGHSFRIGGTTESFICGMEPELAQKLGRWSSSAFLIYWRKVEKIIPLWTCLKEELADIVKSCKD